MRHMTKTLLMKFPMIKRMRKSKFNCYGPDPFDDDFDTIGVAAADEDNEDDQ